MISKAQYLGILQRKFHRLGFDLPDWIDPNLHTILCLDCGRVSQTGDKFHHVKIEKCYNCGSKNVVVFCPVECTGIFLSDYERRHQPRKRKGNQNVLLP